MARHRFASATRGTGGLVANERRITLSDPIKPGTGSGKRRLEQQSLEPNCLGCGMLIELEKRQTRAEERIAKAEADVVTNSSRISAAELNAAHLAGVVEGLPNLIDAKFDSLISVLKTRDSISNSMRLGHDIENSSPPPRHGQAEVRAKDYRLRVSQWVLVLAIIVGAVTYSVVEVASSWGPPKKPPAIISK